MDSVLNRLSEQIQKHQIEVIINEIPKFMSDKAVLDIEHDEKGGYVGSGFIFDDPSHVYYFSDISLVHHLNLPSRKIIGHNIISDIEMLRFWGIAVSEANIYWDTMLIGHIVDSSLKDYGLKAMAKRELDIEYPSYDDIVGKKTAKQKNPRRTLNQQPLEIVSQYNALDCYSTYKLYEKQKTQLAVS